MGIQNESRCENVSAQTRRLPFNCYEFFQRLIFNLDHIFYIICPESDCEVDNDKPWKAPVVSSYECIVLQRFLIFFDLLDN